jgi:hypothetical protein
MRQHLILLFLLAIGLTSSGQINTQKIFNNLPLDKSVKELNEILQTDTLNYKPRKKNVGNCYYSLKADSFFNLIPKISQIAAYNS